MRIELAYELSFDELSKTIGALSNSFGGSFKFISTNSKECKRGDVFFALNGENHRGEDFINEAYEKGAIPVSSSKEKVGIHVNDTNTALLNLAEYYLTKLVKLKEKICITGSVGKTTTKEFLSSLIKDTYITHATYGNYNNLIGVPLTILSAPKDCEILILEFGTNHRGEIAKLSNCVHPTVSVITNIGTSHVGNFGNREIIAKEKSDILSGMQSPFLICEHNEPLLEKIEPKLTVSCECDKADFYLKPLNEDISGTTFDFSSYKGKISKARFNIAGKHMLSTLATAIATALYLGVSAEDLAKKIENLSPSQARHKIIQIADFSILDDSYNASKESIYAALQLLKLYPKENRSALLGDILELGAHTQEIHYEIGRYAYEHGIERLYLFGAFSYYTMQGAVDSGLPRENIFINTDIQNPNATAEFILKNRKSEDIILFKASHKINLNRIIEILKSKERNRNDQQ